MELLVDLRRPPGGSLRRRLEDEIRAGVRAGRLAPGSVMPSSRALAAQLGVSRGVVVEAYAQLVAEGYLSARQGAATVVAARARARAGPAPASVAAPAGAPAGPARPSVAARAGASAGPAPHSHTAPSPHPPPAPAPRYDFAIGVPDLSAFPRRAWLAAGARGLRELPDGRLGYGETGGALELREALAAYLGRARGVVADADRVLVTGGTRQALGVIWRALRERGARRVAVEDPGWAPQLETALDAGLEPVPVPVDADGLQVERLAALDVDAVGLTPAHQFPAGAVLSPPRRAALLQWARDRDAILVEDDYDAEYRYDRDPVGALQGIAPERIVYAGSASKTLAPAVRLGWLVLPPALAATVARGQARAGTGAALLDQLALARLIGSGELDRHLRRMRRRYRRRRDALLAAVAAELPGAAVEGIAAGLHAVVRLPDGSDERATVLAAREHGIAVDGLAAFRIAAAPAPATLVLGYANLSEDAITRAVAELARALR